MRFFGFFLTFVMLACKVRIKRHYFVDSFGKKSAKFDFCMNFICERFSIKTKWEYKMSDLGAYFWGKGYKTASKMYGYELWLK